MLDRIMGQKKIIIDAGHGGVDVGTSGNGFKEKDLTLLISKYMFDQLKDMGYAVSLVRDTDITLNDEDRMNKILDIYGNSSDVILISNHLDSDEDVAQIIYALRDNNEFANLIYNNLIDTDLNVKEPYQLRLPSDTSKDYYYIHRNSGNIEPIMLQYGNLSDSNFAQGFNNDYMKYADAVVMAINSYLGGNNSKYYIVKSGDTLYSIARKYNLTVDRLKELNNLSSNNLTIGQRLIVEEPNNMVDDYITYIVKSGDTLYSIAKEYGVSVDDIKGLNNLSSNMLSIGKRLIIPFSDISSEDVDYITYVVKKGDNLYNIAKTYGVDVKDIMSFNGLSSNLLSIGQRLKIPNSSNKNSVYIVRKGDTLYSIARDYNTSVADIMNKNNLSSSVLSIGQKLII